MVLWHHDHPAMYLLLRQDGALEASSSACELHLSVAAFWGMAPVISATSLRPSTRTPCNERWTEPPLWSEMSAL